MDDPLSKALELGGERNQSVSTWNKPSRHTTRNAHRNQSQGSINDNLTAASTKIELDLDFLHSNRLLVSEDMDDAVTADRYRLLSTRIRQRMEPRQWSRLGITSPSAKEGKTLTCMNLAITAARENPEPVFLIDGDTRRPSIANRLGIEPKAGLVDYLNDGAELSDILHTTSNYPGLYIIPNREGQSRGAFANGRIVELMKELPSQGSTTLIDLPPTLVGDDVLLVAPVVDAMLLVIKDGQSSQTELKATTDLLADCNLLGTVLNCSQEVEKALHGYYYHPDQK